MTIQTVITDRGRAILAARVPGDPPLASVKIAVGDGNGAFPVPNLAQTMLVNERWRGDGQTAVNADKLGFVVTIPAAIGGFAIREVGVYVGPVGAEELLVVSQFDGRYKPPAGENGASALTIVSAIDYSGTVVGAFVITLDENLQALDPNVHRTVTSRLAAPPANPADGSTYAIAAGASGVWAGKGGQIARRKGAAWVYEVPINGHIVRAGAGALYAKSGADYVIWKPDPAAHTHSWADLQGLPAEFPPEAHTHPWAQVTNKPTEYPPSAHGHVIADVTALQAALDGKSPVGHAHAYLPLTGGTLTGDLELSPAVSGLTLGGGQLTLRNASSLQATLTKTAATGNAYIDINPVAEDGVGVSTVRLFRTVASGPAELLVCNADGSATLSHKLAAGAAGLSSLALGAAAMVGFGTASPTEKVHVVGNLRVTGAIKCGSAVGLADQVLVSQAGATNTWSNVIDLLSATDLRAKIGGQTVLAAVNCWGAKPANATAPANLRARGCTVTTNEISSGSPLMVVTFSSPAPNSSYVVMPDQGRVSSKTVNGFTYSLSDLGGLAASVVDLEVYL